MSQAAVPGDPRRSVSLWQHTALPPRQHARLETTEIADVAVIGAGYTGLSAAYHLAAAGKSVVVLEEATIGIGASGRNAAGWIAGWPGLLPGQVIERLGKERGDRMNRMLVDISTYLPRLISEHGLDPEFRHQGIAVGAHTPFMAGGLAMACEQWAEYGADVAYLEPDELRQIVRTDRFHAGMMVRNSGTLNPLNYCRGLATLATEAGARLFEHSGATAARRDANGWTVSTASGAVRCGDIVVATNAYLAGFMPELARCFYAIPATVIATDPQPALADQLLPQGVPIADTHPVNLFWLLRDGAGRLVGSMLPARSRRTDLASLGKLYEEKFAKIFPGFGPLRWKTGWSGYFDVVPDRLIRIIQPDAGIWAPIGYSGNGILAATAVGRELAAAIAANDPEASAVPVVEPRSVPMRRFVPWMLRKVVFPAARRKDRRGY